MTGKKKETAYQRGYQQARADLATMLKTSNAQLKQRMDGLTGKSVILTATGAGLSGPATEYDRGVLAGAMAANRVMQAALEATDAKG